MVTYNHKTIPLLLHNCDFGTVVNCNVDIRYAEGLRQTSVKGSLKPHKLRTTALGGKGALKLYFKLYQWVPATLSKAGTRLPP